MRKRAQECERKGCIEPAEIAGLCRSHHEEHTEDRLLESLAVETLHRSTHAHAVADAALRGELELLRGKWEAACFSVNHRVEDRVLKEETGAAVEWCISLAKEIILADRALSAGKAVSSSLAETRRWVGERFSNLEAGLMSNGVPRPGGR